MVCHGTRLFVIQELEGLGFKYNTFESGEIDFEEDLSLAERKKLDKSLQECGLELTFGKSKLVSKIRHAILDLVEKLLALGTNFS
jgi:hypothetical protein